MTRTLTATIAAIATLPGPAVAAPTPDGDFLDEIVVTSQRRPQNVADHVGNIAGVSAATIARVRHQHVHELMTRVPGTWLSRGSGQENLTAIRSPVLTGPGSCAAFMTLEDGVPTRPNGFCNVNQLFEVPTELANRIEVVRGPGSALYGSNALHGTINVLLPSPGDAGDAGAGVETGSHEFVRLMVNWPFGDDARYRVAALVADDGGFRDAAGYRQAKFHARSRWQAFGGNVIASLTASDLDQQTAGFITGQDAYRDPAVNRSNPNPEAFRDASSQRFSARWWRASGDLEVDIRPFARHSDMTFLQHFLPGQPLEQNGHVSAGVLATVGRNYPGGRIITGVDVEWASVELTETQDAPTPGSPFLMETRPAGTHYDFEVDALAAAAYLQTELAVSEALTLSLGLRAEQVRYDYDNRMLDGNTRDDGTPCGFGGCLYSRPADRDDRFFDVAPKFGATLRLREDTTAFVNIARGFRAPQMTELYRLQSGQQVADLDSETIDSVEIGLRTARSRWAGDVALYAMKKRDSVFRDASGFNVSGAKSRHDGIEVSLDWRPVAALEIAIDASYARHRYDFDRVAAGGETFVSGRDVDTAPRWLASVDLHYQATERLALGVQGTTIGSYFLDAENRFEYPGHRIANGWLRFAVNDAVTVAARVNNVADSRIADRADYAFGQYRYFPGRGREYFVELRYRAAN